MPRRNAAVRAKYDESSGSDDSFAEYIPKKNNVSKDKKGLKGNLIETLIH